MDQREENDIRWRDIEWFRSNHLNNIGPLVFFTGADHGLSVSFMANQIKAIAVIVGQDHLSLMAYVDGRKFMAPLPEFTPRDLPRLQGYVNEIWLDALMALKHY